MPFANNQPAQKTQYHEVPDGTYCCWLNMFKVSDDPNSAGVARKRVGLAFKVAEDAEAGQYLWANFYVETAGAPNEKAETSLENTLKALVDGYYHQKGAPWEPELQQVVELCDKRLFYVRKTTTRDGYKRVYVQCERP